MNELHKPSEITYAVGLVSTVEVKDLLQASGMWAQEACLDRLALALEHSSVIISARSAQRELIGVGRVISDGAVFALIAMLVVHPAYQAMGIGSVLLKRMLAGAEQANILTSFVLAEEGKIDFYRRHGFQPNPGLLMHRPVLDSLHDKI
jgi:N-acetylglutamate synthase-like GNAT family acetyltransferase